MSMEEHPMEVSPRVLARIGGALYLIMIVLGAVGEVFVRGRIVVWGDATATAANLRSMESLWRFGIASELFQGICAVVLALIIYVLTRPVSKRSRLAGSILQSDRDRSRNCLLATPR